MLHGRCSGGHASLCCGRCQETSSRLDLTARLSSLGFRHILPVSTVILIFFFEVVLHVKKDQNSNIGATLLFVLDKTFPFGLTATIVALPCVRALARHVLGMRDQPKF